MARRSYLQRIAEPLLPGEPVLFPIPRAAPDEARPAVSVSPVTSGIPKSLRRAPASAARAVQAEPDMAPARASAAQSGPPWPKLAPEHAVLAPAPPTPPVPRTDPVSAAEPQMRSDPPRTKEPATPAPRPEGDAETERGIDGAVPSPSIVAEPASASLPTQRAGETAAQFAPALPDSPPNAVRPVLPTGATDPVHRRPPAIATPAADAASDRASRAASNIHIGTIEVRAAAPAPPAPAPAPAATPPVSHAAPAAASPTRGYGWRFGLIQG